MPASQFVICQGPQTGGETVSTSASGFTWTERFGALDGQASTIAYGNGLYVYSTFAIGSDPEAIQTSPDGINWTPRSSPADGGLVFMVLWVEDLGLFVAAYATTSDAIMTSPDGITWTAQTIPSPATFGFSGHPLAWSPDLGLLLAVGDNTGFVMTSPDGVVWTDQTTPDANHWVCAAWGSGLFVSFGGGFASSGTHQLMTSPDGITWTIQTPIGNQTFESIIFAGGQFVAMGIGELTEDLLRVATSPDGLTWTLQTVPPRDWWGAVYGTGLYVMVANDNPMDGSKAVITSRDGITWTERGSDVYPINCRGIAWNGGSLSGNYLDGPGQGGNQAW